VATRKDDSSDAEAFLSEMADVVPLPPDPRGRSHPKAPISTPRHAVTSSPSNDLDGSDEEFAASGVSRGELRKLRRGDYPAQDRLDLHGLTAGDAVAASGRFLDESRQRRQRCVCIVHGRGLHSEGSVAVLKSSVRAHLKSHRSVLAYADAPRSDGGPGAVYVLLRK
jgi:DNA-nicking Smr family endonuclease